MKQLSLSLFGSFQASVAERPLTQFRTNKVQALLIYLAIEAPTVHRRDQLMELLWPGLPQKSAQVNLRQTTYQLKKAIPDLENGQDDTIPFMVSQRQTIQQNPAFPTTSDVAQFLDLLKQARQHNHEELLSCPECQLLLETAVSLYKGEFLADFSLYDSNAYETWAQTKREGFRRQTVDVLDTLTHIYIEQEAYQQAEDTARQQLQLDNLREDGYQQLMQILALTGRRSEALALYQKCQQLLQVELGMAPAVKTTALFEQIKTGDLSVVTPQKKGIRGYDLQDELGKGAFGTVYRAQQKGIGREVAIKIIQPQYANQPDFIRRFEAEAQIIARLEHPYIVPLYDYWREPDAAYLVMRWLRGGSLQAALEKRPYSANKAARILTQIADALTTAHRQNIVHRDIKPSNILLDEDGNGYLSDFGIAKDFNNDNSLTNPNQIIGSPAYISPEQLLGETVSPATDIYSLGLVLYELLTGARPFSTTSIVELIQKQINEPLPLVHPQRPDLPAMVDEVIQQATAKKATDRYDTPLALAQAFQQIVQSNGQMVADPQIAKIIEIAESEISNPYKGLRAFQETDAANFYGRSALIQQLLNRLATSQAGENHQLLIPPDFGDSKGREGSHFLAIVGPSGSGKSSVVKAGVLPAIRNNVIPNSDNWFIVEMIPSAHPLEELEAALLHVAVNPPPSLLEPLQKDERGLVRTIKRILPQQTSSDQPSHLLLFIDQFEELFTLVADETARKQFIQLLLTALNEPRLQFHLIVTLRADFYDRPLQYPQLGQLLKENTEIILPLAPAEIEEVITLPAQQMGVQCGSGLVSAIIADVNEQPGALPLMQYALTELFEKRNGRLMTLDTYNEIGGVTAALAKRADEIYDGLNPEAWEITHQLFLRLVTLGEGVEDTRRRVLRAELGAIQTSEGDNQLSYNASEGLNAVIDIYGRYRLLTFDNDPITREPTVEVAHEALIREWVRLQDWLREGRSDVRLQRLLATATTEWINANRDEGYLLRESRLDLYQNWINDTKIALTQDEQSFLNASIAARKQRYAEEEVRQQRELETAQQLAETERKRAEEQTHSAQNLRKRAVYLGLALVVAVVLGITAVYAGIQATNNADTAVANANNAATQEALAAVRAEDAQNSANSAATAEAVAQENESVAIFAQETAVASESIAITEQEIADEERQKTQEQLHLTTSRELALAANANLETNPERSLLLGLTALDNAYTTEAEEVVRAAVQASRIEMTLTKEGEDIWWIDYHPEGDWLAGISDEGIILWDTNSGNRLQTIPLEVIHNGNFGELNVSPNGSTLAVVTQNQILILDTNSWEIIHTLEGHSDTVENIAFNPTNTLLASGSTDGELKVWDIILGVEKFTVVVIDEGNFGGFVDDVRFSPDGSLIATADDGGFARIWDVATGEEISAMSHDARWINNIEFNADGTRLFTAPGFSANGNRLTIWDIEKNPNGVLTEPLAEWFDMHDNSVLDLKLSPDGRYLATISQDSTLKLWDATNDTATEILTLSGHPVAVTDVAFSPDSNKIATLSGGEVRIWNISEAGFGEVLNIADDSLPITYQSETNSLVTATKDGAVKIWDSMTGNLLKSFDIQLQNRLIATTVSSDGHYLAKGSNDNILGLWNLTTQQEVYTRTTHSSGMVGGIFTGVIDITFSPDGKYLATGGADGYVKLWDVESGDELTEWQVDPRISIWSEEGVPNGVTRVIFSPNGRFLAASTDETDDGEGGDQTAIIKIWDLESNAEMTVIENIPRRIWGLAISPDSKLIAGTGGSGVIKVWDVETGNEVANLEGVTQTVYGVVFSVDSRQLIINYGKIVIYDLESKEATIAFPKDYNHFILSSDGHYLATATQEGNIQIYTLDFDELRQIAESRVTRELTKAECKEYLHLEACPVEDE